MDDFSKRLKSLRLSMGLTQKQFGLLGDVTDTVQGNYKTDNKNKRQTLGLNYLINLKENDINVYYLLTGEKVDSSLDHDESLILGTFRNSNDQSKKLMFDLCRTLSRAQTSLSNTININSDTHSNVRNLEKYMIMKRKMLSIFSIILMSNQQLKTIATTLLFSLLFMKNMIKTEM